MGKTRKTILIVDDHEYIRESLAEILSGEGYGVVCAANGREALSRLRTPPHPCLILLDLMMPVMNGWEFRRAQRQDPELSAIPVVVLTAGNMIHRRTELQAKAWLSKPFTCRKLFALIEENSLGQ